MSDKGKIGNTSNERSLFGAIVRFSNQLSNSSSSWLGVLGAVLGVVGAAVSHGTSFSVGLTRIFPIVLLFLIALLVVLFFFTFLLKREPSEVAKLKKSLIQAYLGALESSSLAPTPLRDRRNA